MATQLPLPQKERSPNFRPMSIVAKRLDGSRWHMNGSIDLGPGHIVLDGEPAPPAKGAEQPPSLFGPFSLWRRSPMSSTAELLFTYTTFSGIYR